MNPHWDRALVNWLSSSARAGLREDVWMETHAEVAALVVNPTHVASVRAATAVRDCSRELRELCSSSLLGQRVYGGLLSQLCFDEYALGLDAIIEEVLDGDIYEETMAEANAKAEELATKWEYATR